MYDPAVDLIIRAIGNKKPYEELMQLVDTVLLPYINEITRDKRLRDLFDSIYKCKKCDLCPVPGNRATPEGNTYAEIMLVGEAAGEQECQQNRPFVGPAGQLLSRMLEAAASNIDVRFTRANLYITNVVKGRPVADNKNRQPTPEERIACNNFLMEEIELVRPKVIICVGSVAAEVLISPSFKISAQQGIFFGDEPKKIAMYHPSYLLRLNEGSKEQLAAKTACWKVLKEVNDYLNKTSGLPRV